MENKNFTKHGLTKTKIYRAWCGMISRCENKKEKGYKNYGGRGILVCKEWRNNFMAFYKWSMENGYKEDLDENGKNKISIDRIDVNGNYEPSNCRWVDRKTQANNTTKNHICFYNGEWLTCSQIADKYNINYATLVNRLWQGMTIEEAINKPKIKRSAKQKHIIVYKGVEYTIRQFAEKFNINIYTVKTRVARGWEAEEIAKGARYENRKIRIKQHLLRR